MSKTVLSRTTLPNVSGNLIFFLMLFMQKNIGTAQKVINARPRLQHIDVESARVKETFCVTSHKSPFRNCSPVSHQVLP